jgi:hypothetical protein
MTDHRDALTYHRRHTDDGLRWAEGCALCPGAPPGADPLTDICQPPRRVRLKVGDREFDATVEDHGAAEPGGLEDLLRLHMGGRAPLVRYADDPPLPPGATCPGGVLTLPSNRPLSAAEKGSMAAYASEGLADGGAPEPRMRRLYVAGVISGDPRPFEEKRDAFYEAADRLRAAGYDPVVPLDIGNDLCEEGDSCKASSAKVLAGSDQGAGHSWECYLRHDLIEALRCDGAALIPNWHLSPGARLEFATLTAVGLPCLPVEEWLDLVGYDPPPDGLADRALVRIKQVHCSLCRRPLHWADGRWWDDGLDEERADVCRGATAPDVAHEPERNPR